MWVTDADVADRKSLWNRVCLNTVRETAIKGIFEIKGSVGMQENNGGARRNGPNNKIKF